MSSDAQLRGDSLRRQMELSRAYAAEEGLTLVEDLPLDDIGVSAFQGENLSTGALGKFLALASAGQIERGSYLLVESLDRITRQNPQKATRVFLEILDAGINIVTLGDRRIYRAGDSDFGDIIYSVVVLSRAHDESLMKSQRVGEAWKNKRRNAGTEKLTRIAPSWLSLADDRQHFVVDEARSEIVRRIFNEADMGRGAFQIARLLNSEGVAPFGDSRGWHESYLTRILTNRAVLGEFQPHHYVKGKRVPDGDPVPGYFPAIISTEQYARVQMGRLARKNRGSGRKGSANTNLFSQVARCGYCNSRIYLIDKGPKPKGGLYLRCDSARRGNDCIASNWPLGHFEQVFLTFVRELDVEAVIDAPGHLERTRSTQAELATLQMDLEKKRALRRRAFQLLEMEEVDISFVREELSLHGDSIKLLEARIAELSDELGAPLERKMRDAEMTLSLIASLQLADQKASEARLRIADWIRTNVRELLLFSDGIEEETAEGTAQKRRQFAVSFNTGKFRLVECIGNDPSAYSFSVEADGELWVETTISGSRQI